MTMPPQSSSVLQLQRAVEESRKVGVATGVENWMDRELDSMGRPNRLPVEDWLGCVSSLSSRETIDRLPEAYRYRVVGLLATILRFRRPDGRAVFDEVGTAGDDLAMIARSVEAAGDASLTRVLASWKPRKNEPHASTPPPLPFDQRLDRVSSALRADWMRTSDWAAVDHRGQGPITRFELAIGGRPLLGPRWGVPSLGPSKLGARLIQARSGTYADLAEWSVRSEARSVIRTLLMLRGRRIALLAEQYDRAGGEMKLGLYESVEFRASELDRSFRLRSAGRRASTSLIPLGQSADRDKAEGSSFEIDPTGVTLGVGGPSRRSWNPLLVCWGRPPSFWRQLTVSERSKACPPDVAFAARVAWGARDEGLVIYRSLVKSGLRAFLGHQTRSSFLIGRIDSLGRVVPIFSLD